MWFDFHNKVVYQHLFKTGGHSIYKNLVSYHQDDQDILNKWVKDKDSYKIPYNVLDYDVSNHHITFDEFSVIWPKIKWEEYWKFGFIRNTYDFLVASYKHQMQISYFLHLPNNESKQLAAKAFTFEHFITNIWGYDYTQWDFITYKGKINLDFIGRFENLQDDYNKVLDHIGLPRKNLEKIHSSENREYVLTETAAMANQHYSLWYTDKLLEFVKIKAKNEIEYFDFIFVDKR